MRQDCDGRPQARQREDAVDRSQVEVKLRLDEVVEERDQLAGAQRSQKAGQEEPEEEPAVQEDQAESVALRGSLAVACRSIAGEHVDGPERQDAQDRHARQQDLVRRLSGPKTEARRQLGRARGADDGRDNRGDEPQRRPDREVLVALTRQGVLGDEGDLHDADDLRARAQRRGAEEQQLDPPGQERQQRCSHQGDPDGHDPPPPESVGECAGRERYRDAREHRRGQYRPHQRALADRLEVEVEVEPVQAGGRAEDDRGQQEEASVTAESREAAQVPGQGAGHRVPSRRLLSGRSERGPRLRRAYVRSRSGAFRREGANP